MKIVKIKKVGKKYNILFDDTTKITTFDDVIINNSLLFDKEVDQKLLDKIIHENSYYDLYYKAVNYISHKLRSEKEINLFLQTDIKTKQKIINKLKQIGLINDLNFTKAYIADKFNLSNLGPYKIKKDLLEHDIDSSIIDDELTKIDDDLIINKINKLITKQIKNSKYAGFYLKQKVINYIVNLGFDKEMIINLYDNFKFDNTSLIQKEYDKLFKKLSNKYNSFELENNINKKLYAKGFKQDEIKGIKKV
ncbi:MAG: RecX family transcriptional regulator [Bacilli bacterium]